GSAGPSSGRPGDGSLPLQRIDVTAARLQLLGGVFPDTRLLVVPAPGGAIAARAEGASLQGELLLPAGDEAVAGKFRRVHWRSARAGSTAATGTGASADRPAARAVVATTATTPQNASNASGINPADIPPLLIEVDDLRLADARLGKASLRTRPTGAGMRVDQLQARNGKQLIELSGSWLGHGGSERTHLTAKVDSEDFGRLLTGLGHGGRRAGGEGEVALARCWTGTRAESAVGVRIGPWSPAVAEGRRQGGGPAAGRVVGALTLAEPQRRLAVFFRVFYRKGSRST